MPRPRVKDEDRKRVARACDTCKRRKEKCDGSHPCLLCRRRNREAECTYALARHRRSGGDASQRGSISEASPSLQLGEALASNSPNDAEIAIESLLTLSGSRSAPKTPAATGPYDASAMSHAPVPKLARLLRDGHGKFIFVGDSSNLAFLQNIRRLARTSIGESNLTTDPMRHSMIEAIPASASEKKNVASSAGLGQSVRPRPTRHEAEDLVNQYLLAASGVVDLFDRSDIIQHLASWTEGTAPSNPSTDSIFYLVLAIGARNKLADYDDQAELYFTRGRELAMSSFMDDPSVLTVQSYILIAFYMLTACRRNGAFVLLGIAIRAAYALGLHRSDISTLFETRERKTRERVWKSLRVLDLFMSASLGRPPATSEVDGGNVSWEGQTRGYENIKMGALHSSAMLRICFIFERILNEVYCRREVDIQLVNSISRQYRDWNMALDTGLVIDGLTEDDAAPASGIQHMLGLAHLKGAYYWSIILLTRPFLIFDVSSKISSDDQPTIVQSPRTSSDTSTLSEACVDAALRSIEIASDVIHTPSCPKRPVLITNSVFVSACVVGLAILGDYDKSFPLLSSLEQAKLVLGIVAKNDPSARRYFLIIGYLQQAALEHIRRRDEKQLQKRRQGIHSIFGNLLNRENSSDQSPGQNGPRLSNAGSESAPAQPVRPDKTREKTWAQRLDETESRRGPTLTTSGMLASASKDGPPANFEMNLPAPEGDSFINLLDPMNTDPTAIPTYAEEFPLFSLMNDYTEGDQFFEML